MSREYVYFLSHAPTGSLCSLGSLRSLYVISHVRFNTKEKPNQKKRSCPPSQQRTLRPFSIHLGHSTHGVVGRTRVRIPLRTILFKELLARASYYKHVSLGPQDLDRSLGRHVRPYTETRNRYVPKIRPFEGGENVIRLTGLGNRSIFYPGSSVGITITRSSRSSNNSSNRNML